MGYFTVYNYRDKDLNLIIPDSVACFDRLYTESVPHNTLTEINIYLLCGETPTNYKHLMEHSKEEVVEFLSYFQNLFTQPLVVTSISKELFMKEMGDTAEDAEEAKYDLDNTVKVTIPLDNSSLLYIKFVTTLVRYFYEEEHDYKKIINRFLKYRRDKEYDEIPSIELFQLCHSFYVSNGSHAFFYMPSYRKSMVTKVIDETVILVNLRNSGSSSLNGLFSCGTREGKGTFTELIQKYNENIRSRE